MSKRFIRDERSPKPLNAKVSRVMSANRSKDTGPERFVRKRLSEMDIKGYRLNWKKAAGKPDIAFVSKKIAIFVHGCFWHACEKCQVSTPKNNSKFWKAKFKRNKDRDQRNLEALKDEGWKVFVIRECDIEKNDAKAILARMAEAYEKKSLLRSR